MRVYLVQKTLGAFAQILLQVLLVGLRHILFQVLHCYQEAQDVQKIEKVQLSAFAAHAVVVPVIGGKLPPAKVHADGKRSTPLIAF